MLNTYNSRTIECDRFVHMWNTVNVPVCDPFLVCRHFFIFSSIDQANDKKPYDNHYKHYPE